MVELMNPGGSGGEITVTDGTHTVTDTTEINFTSGAVVTNAGGGVANVAISGGGFTYWNEVVSGSGTSWTLAHSPSVAGNVLLFGDGIAMRPGAGNDYTISGANITTAISHTLLLAFY